MNRFVLVVEIAQPFQVDGRDRVVVRLDLSNGEQAIWNTGSAGSKTLGQQADSRDMVIWFQ
jgi:hypothetical protein